MTVKHVLLDCPALLPRRQAAPLFREPNVTLRYLLGNDANIFGIMNYLRIIGLFDRV